VPPRQGPRVGVHGRLGHLVRREIHRPPARLHLAGLEVAQERGQDLVQPLVGDLVDIVQLLLQLLVAEMLCRCWKGSDFSQLLSTSEVLPRSAGESEFRMV
jgi:hypothetical protein